jgi:hypothetical protein
MARRRTQTQHDAWIRDEIERGLREADDPRAARIPNDEAVARWRRLRAEFVKRAGKPEF